MNDKLKNALLVLKHHGWRPLQSLAGIPTAGVSAPGGFEPYSLEERVAVEELKKLGWTCIDENWELAGHRGSYAAPPDRTFEEVWNT